MMRFGILGTLRVESDEGPIGLSGARQRRLLTLLLIHANRVVSIDTLVEALWRDTSADAVRDRQQALWVVVSRLRTALEPTRPRRSDGTILLTRPPGYQLAVEPDDLDSLAFAALADTGRVMLDSDPLAAGVLLGEALDLWRGSALEEFAYEPFAAAEIARLDELRLACLGNRIDADLRVGRSHELVAELAELAEQHPLHQRIVGQRMVALCRAGRHAEALGVYGSVRRRLRDELGLDPSAPLVELERRILHDDPRLTGPESVRLTTGRSEYGIAMRGYELRATIGSGSSGRVYLAEQPSTGRRVAIKSIRPERADDPEFIRRFEAEARLVASFDHPNVVPVFDFWRESDQAFLVMRLVDHGSLADRLAVGGLPCAEALEVVMQIGRALDAAHDRGLVHGDLRPTNVLLDDDGRAQVSDFGLSFAPAAGGRPVEYLAPERSSPIDGSPLSDIYSLGALTSAVLFPGDEPDDAVAEVIGRAMHPDPAQRWPTAAAFVDALTAEIDVRPSPEPADAGAAGAHA